MKLKYSLVLFAIGFVLLLLGALFKILHYMYASELLSLGTLFQVIATIMGVIRLISNDKFKDFLNQ